MQENSEIAALEYQLDGYRKQIERGQAVARLMANRDFKKIILEGYFKDEAVRLVHLKQAPDFQTDDKQRNILRDIDSIGTFRNYLNLVEYFAGQASQAIGVTESVLEEARQEALNDE